MLEWQWIIKINIELSEGKTVEMRTKGIDEFLNQVKDNNQSENSLRFLTMNNKLFKLLEKRYRKNKKNYNQDDHNRYWKLVQVIYNDIIYCYMEETLRLNYLNTQKVLSKVISNQKLTKAEKLLVESVVNTKDLSKIDLQIAHKPTLYNYEDGHQEYHCPRCGKYVESCADYPDIRFCTECGQRLDWTNYNQIFKFSDEKVCTVQKDFLVPSYAFEY